MDFSGSKRTLANLHKDGDHAGAARSGGSLLGGLKNLSHLPSPATRSRVTLFLVRNRQTVMMTVVALVLGLEVIEHLLITIFGEQMHFFFDAFIYTTIVPMGMWFLLSLLESTETEREIAEQDNDQRAAFSQRLGESRTFDELVHQIVEYAHLVAPRAQVTLFVFNNHKELLEPSVAFRPEAQVVTPVDNGYDPDDTPISALPRLIQAQPALAAEKPANLYDLAIVRNEQEIGVLKLEYPSGEIPKPEEIQALKAALPIMALALEGGILQNVAAEQAQASDHQRQEIAQHLHDTLAQNISYLRLKLDQLTGENAIREIGMVLGELERMRSTANEAYHQVRSTLDELNPTHGEDLSSVLVRQARAISKRAAFSLRSSTLGTPFPVPPGARQQILYIVREALHNVEKHANASQVLLQFLWLESELIIKITDDGVGFDPLQVNSDGHYGLWIMQHRADEIGGSLKFAPAGDQAAGGGQKPDGNRGTEVTLWVPRIR